MPKSSNYGASYPDGAIIAHNGEVTNEADPDSDAPRYEDTRPTIETDGKQTADERGEDNPTTTHRETAHEAGDGEQPKQAETAERADEKSKPTALDSGNDTGRKPAPRKGTLSSVKNTDKN